jgi:hypothetical protein
MPRTLRELRAISAERGIMKGHEGKGSRPCPLACS